MASTKAAAAHAREAQVEYLAALRQERSNYVDAGAKDRAREVDAEIKRVEATLKAGRSKPPVDTRADEAGDGDAEVTGAAAADA